jgi:hypothetical protein
MLDLDFSQILYCPESRSVMVTTEHKIDFTALLGYPIAVEFSPWKEGVSWIQHTAQGAFKSEYYEESGIPLSFLMHQSQTQAWCEMIPLEIAEAVIQFESQFKNYAFEVLWFTSRSDAASQLLLSSPLLMWLVLRYSIKNQLPVEEVYALFYCKRTDILKLFGLEASKAILKFFNRYPLQDFDQFELEKLKEFLTVHNIVHINRLKTFNLSLIRWLISEPKWIHAGFVKNLDSTTQINTVKSHLEDTMRMGRQLRNASTEKNILNCSSIQEVVAMHDVYIERINQKTFDKYADVEYPTPTLEGSETIVPILNYKDLYLEGKGMKHCIVSYHDRLVEGEYLVFKVLEPERATLGLTKKNGKFSIDEIRLKCNKAPSEETKETVYWWFQNA